ncbi:MAG TPA: M67 family metallopeptidase [Actinomycetota bacterium]
MIEIPADIREAMIAHAREEVPNEACGLLAGPEGRAEHVFRMQNADKSPMTYRLDSTEQLRVFNEIEEKGWEIAAIYHSHTHTQAYPSETDRSQAFYPDAHYILVSLADPDPVVRAFTILDGVIEEQELRIV